MRSTRVLGMVAAAIMALSACIAPGPAEPTTSIGPTTTTGTVAPSTLPPVVQCPGDGDFHEGASIADIDGEGSDGSHLRRISWETSDQCESISFDFETSEGAPATAVPAIRVDHLETFQVIRIRVAIDAAVVTDQLVETPLVERLYVVRALDGGMFVDLHLNEPAGARARVESSPARLTIDLRPGLVPFTGASIIGEQVVVVSPPRDATVERSPMLRGYARTFEANVLVVVSQASEVVSEMSITAADYLETWGEFETLLTLPEGIVSMFVGEASPEDGTLRGVVFDVSAR